MVSGRELMNRIRDRNIINVFIVICDQFKAVIYKYINVLNYIFIII